MSQDWHVCAVPGCLVLIRHDKLMCPRHWRQVPPALKARLTRAWNHGSTDAATWISVRRACIDAVTRPGG